MASTWVKLLSVPPVAETSARVKPTGASLKVKVAVAVSPTVSEVSEIDTETVGAVVSIGVVLTAKLALAPAAPVLPAASV